MTKIKFCGLRTLDDVYFANEIFPEYVGFVFAPESKRYVTPAQAEKLRGALSKKILAVGVFVNEKISVVSELLDVGIIDVAQIHGNENDEYIKSLHSVTKKAIIRAFQIHTADDMATAEKSSADFVLLDAGTGCGKVFNWKLINLSREYFLAGGLTTENVDEAIKLLKPYAVDVSSGIETSGRKDFAKMKAFASIVRN